MEAVMDLACFDLCLQRTAQIGKIKTIRRRIAGEGDK